MKKNSLKKILSVAFPTSSSPRESLRCECGGKDAHRRIELKRFKAGPGWDVTTGMGSPKADQVVNFLTLFTSDSDAYQAMNNSDPSATQHGGHHDRLVLNDD